MDSIDLTAVPIGCALTVTVQQRPAPHPTSLREATLSSFVCLIHTSYARC